MDWIENFEWESDAQKKGYLAFVKWARNRGLPCEVRPIDLFFIQKDHESTQWLIETFGNQISAMQADTARKNGHR